MLLYCARSCVLLLSRTSCTVTQKVDRDPNYLFVLDASHTAVTNGLMVSSNIG